MPSVSCPTLFTNWSRTDTKMKNRSLTVKHYFGVAIFPPPVLEMSRKIWADVELVTSDTCTSGDDVQRQFRESLLPGKKRFVSFFRFVGYGFAGYLIIASSFFSIFSLFFSSFFEMFHQPQRVPFFLSFRQPSTLPWSFVRWLVECCFTSTVTVGFLGTGFLFVLSLPFLFPRPVPPLLVRGFVCKIHFYNRWLHWNSPVMTFQQSHAIF